MRWLVFLIFAYVALVLEAGLFNLWRVWGVGPSLTLVLMVFISLWAGPWTVVWSAMVLGLLVDLRPWGVGGGAVDAAIFGPGALGYMAGAYVCLQVRGLMFRDSPVSLGVMVFPAGIFVHLVATALLTARGVAVPGVGWLGGWPVENWGAADQLAGRFLEVVYTALVSVPVGYVLRRTVGWWGFERGQGRGASGFGSGRRGVAKEF